MAEDVKSESIQADREMRKEEAIRNAAKKAKRTTIIVSVLAGIVLTASLATFLVIIPSMHYNQGNSYMEAKNWDAARREFLKANNFNDAKSKATEALYQKALSLKAEGDYDSAISVFNQIAHTQDEVYDIGMLLLESGRYVEAVQVFNNLNGYKDSNDKSKESIYRYANDLCSNNDYDAAYIEFQKIIGYKDVSEILKNNVDLKIAIGNYIVFGTFEQDGNSSTLDPIEWWIVGKSENQVILLSRYCLGYDYVNHFNAPSNAGERIVDYLKKSFTDEAFSEEEKRVITSITILSKAEVEQYLPNPKDRITTATKAAGGGDGSWWTRSYGRGSTDSTAVNARGEFVAVEGTLKNYNFPEEKWYEGYKGIRPAIFIAEANLKKYLSK